MAGLVYTICPPTTYIFDQLVSSIGMSISLPIATRVDIRGYEIQFLHVRTHALTAQGAGDTLVVDVASSGYTLDDPATTFQAGQVLASVTLLQSPSPPNIQTVILNASNSSEFVDIRITGTRSNALANALNAKLSIDLVLKTAGNRRIAIRRKTGTFLGYY